MNIDLLLNSESSESSESSATEQESYNTDTNKDKYDKENKGFIRSVAKGTAENCLTLSTRLNDYQGDLIDNNAVNRLGRKKRESLIMRDENIKNYVNSKYDHSDENSKENARLSEIGLKSMVDTNLKTDSIKKNPMFLYLMNIRTCWDF